MLTKQISNDKLTDFLNNLLSARQLIAPTREDGIISFKPMHTGEEVCLDYQNSIVPPKEFFFPKTERMFSFTSNNSGIEIDGEERGPERVIFGIRPCDIQSIYNLDPVFLDGPHPDGYYQQKREATTIIGLACHHVSRHCFCKSFAIKPWDAKGSDIFLIRMDDRFGVKILTEKGRDLIQQYEEYFMDDGGQTEIYQEELRLRLEKQFFLLPDPGESKDILDRHFELSYWSETAARCLGCGICTYVCPTCHCFDIYDVSRGDTSGERLRCWDSCMYSDFTEMAGGHNPRPDLKQRLRNRMMHKLKYHNDRYDRYGCVGCGRCVAKCPVNIDIRQVMADLKEVAVHE